LRRLLVRLVTSVVGLGCGVWRRSRGSSTTGPPGATVGREAGTAASASSDTGEKEEDQEAEGNQNGQNNPSAPRIPVRIVSNTSTVSSIVSATIVVVVVEDLPSIYRRHYQTEDCVECGSLMIRDGKGRN
jgi:hypothetical protein